MGGIFLVLGLASLSIPSAWCFEHIEISIDRSDDAFHSEMAEAVARVFQSGGGQIELKAPEPEAGPSGWNGLLGMGRPQYMSSHEDAYRVAYRNGDLYFLVGDLSNGSSKDSWAQEEWNEFYDIARWLVKKRFRAIINPSTQEADLREAVSNPKTAGIVWSGHGSKDGYLTDAIPNVVDSKAFVSDASPSFKHLVWSSCNGEKVVQTYGLASWTTAHHWFGPTYTHELFSYLRSKRWDRDLLSDLGLREF